MNSLKNFPFIFISFFSFLVISCSKDPKPINFGAEDCDYCKMTISDNRFGAEIVTKQGRIYKFDDLHCLKGFLDDESVPKEKIHSTWLVDFTGNGKLINSEKSFLIRNDELRSPMGANIAAFKNENDLNNYQSDYSGTEIKWEDFLNSK